MPAGLLDTRAWMRMAACAAARGNHHRSAPATQREAEALRKKMVGVSLIRAVVVLVSAGLTVSSILGAVTAMILYVRPLLKAAEQAAESTDAAARDVQNAAIEMEKTAIMFQQDVPTTMRELQKASDEWELVGKQLNVAVTSVTRPLKPVEKPVERAAEWVGEMVGEKSTAKFSKRIVSETTAVANVSG